jgi:hypothetical protein
MRVSALLATFAVAHSSPALADEPVNELLDGTVLAQGLTFSHTREEHFASNWMAAFEYGVNAPDAPPCESEITDVDIWWPGRDLLGTQAISGDPLVVEVDGCFQNGLVWTSSSGAFEGEGRRVTLYTDPFVHTVDVQACTADAEPVCVGGTIQLVDPEARIRIDDVEVTADYGYGKYLRVNGHVDDPAGLADTYEVTLFKHADIFYEERTRVVPNADGSWTKSLFVLNNVDRINALIVAPGALSVDQDNCRSRLCWPRTHPLSGEHIPWVPDSATSWDHATYFLIPELTGDRRLDNLVHRISPRQMRNGAPWGYHFIRGGLQRDRFHLYTQAMGIIGLSAEGRFDDARKILNALSYVQNTDGSWYFEYYEWGRSPYPSRGDKRYMWANAWIGMAINFFHAASGTQEYRAELEGLLDFLVANRIDIDGNLAVQFNPTDLSSTSWNETQVAAVEHNVDAWSAFKGYRLTMGDDRYQAVEQGLLDFVDARWTGSRFNPGSHVTAGDNIHEIYMQSAAWATLALTGEGTDYADVLDFNCQHFFDPAGIYDEETSHIPGFSDMMLSDGTSPNGQIVWSEGTLSQLMAMQVAYANGRTDICQGRSPDDLLWRIQQVAGAIDGAGGLPQTTLDDHPEYKTTSDTTPLVWLLLTEAGINPFRPWDHY